MTRPPIPIKRITSLGASRNGKKIYLELTPKKTGETQTISIEYTKLPELLLCIKDAARLARQNAQEHSGTSSHSTEPEELYIVTECAVGRAKGLPDRLGLRLVSGDFQFDFLLNQETATRLQRLVLKGLAKLGKKHSDTLH